MINIINFDACPQSTRAGTYGGNAGFKDGICYEGELWMVKYPKSTLGMRDMDMSYTTSPLSEYLGSQIYSILGFDTHKTLLGHRNGKIVVVCKDFCEREGQLREIRTLKNLANSKLETLLDEQFSSTGDAHVVNLEELQLHLEYNDILSKVPGIKKRFWDCVIVDLLINNNDRNNGNWGVLYEEDGYRLAPVFDNGASFSNKLSDERIKMILEDPQRMRQSAMSCSTGFQYLGKEVFVTEVFSLPYEELIHSVLKLTPIIIDKGKEIANLFNSIPVEHNGLYICSELRKQYYLESMEMKLQQILIPEYNKRAEISIDPEQAFFASLKEQQCEESTCLFPRHCR